MNGPRPVGNGELDDFTCAPLEQTFIVTLLNWIYYSIDRPAGPANQCFEFGCPSVELD